MFSMLRTRVQSLVRELKPLKPCSAAKNKIIFLNEKKKKTQKLLGTCRIKMLENFHPKAELASSGLRAMCGPLLAFCK